MGKLHRCPGWEYPLKCTVLDGGYRRPRFVKSGKERKFLAFEGEGEGEGGLKGRAVGGGKDSLLHQT